MLLTIFLYKEFSELANDAKVDIVEVISVN